MKTRYQLTIIYHGKGQYIRYVSECDTMQEVVEQIDEHKTCDVTNIIVVESLWTYSSTEG